MQHRADNVLASHTRALRAVARARRELQSRGTDIDRTRPYHPEAPQVISYMQKIVLFQVASLPHYTHTDTSLVAHVLVHGLLYD